MAYAAAITRTRSRINGRAIHTITIVETGATAGTEEYAVDNVPARGRLLEHRCVLTAAGAGATATTVDPELGTATTLKDILENGAAAASTTNLNLTVGYSSAARTLSGRSKAGGGGGNIGATGNITTVLVIGEGTY